MRWTTNSPQAHSGCRKCFAPRQNPAPCADLGVLERLKLVPMRDLYRVVIPGVADVTLGPNRAATVAALQERFPACKDGIAEWFDLLWGLFGDLYPTGRKYGSDFTPCAASSRRRCTSFIPGGWPSRWSRGIEETPSTRTLRLVPTAGALPPFQAAGTSPSFSTWMGCTLPGLTVFLLSRPRPPTGKSPFAGWPRGWYPITFSI